MTRPLTDKKYDVLVIGGGNAGICAAMMAAEQGASVLVVEAAPKDFRSGNSRHTRNFRCMHQKPNDVLTGAYKEDEYFEDLLRVTGGETNEVLARMAIRESEPTFDWMKSRGARFQPALGGTLHLSRTNAFFLGGGKALMNAYYRTVERMGIDVMYDTAVDEVDIQDGFFNSAIAVRGGERYSVSGRAVVFASGGFESNLEWLKEGWGAPAENFLIRGTPYNMGRCLRLLMDNGAKTIGDPTQGHMVAIDARAPKYDGGISTRVDCVSLGIVVNREAKRFYDEGEDFWPKRYAIWGRLVALQPGQVAYSIIDAKAVGKFMPPVFPPIGAKTLGELAGKLSLDVATFEKTVAEFNGAVRPGTFDHAVLDDCKTEGLDPPKTHWARAIDTPPFYAYPVAPGLTFTYLGVGVNEQSKIIMSNGKPSANMFAAGEIMAGNVLGKGYLAGIGMTIGTVFGRIAGREAGRHVRN